MVKTFTDLIGTWPRGVGKDGRALTHIAAFAADVGITYYHAQVMKFRNSIGADYWPRVLKAAERRGLPVTEKDLFRMREDLMRQRAEEKRAKAARPKPVVGSTVRAA